MNDGALVSLGSASMISIMQASPMVRVIHILFLGFWAITITCA